VSSEAPTRRRRPDGERSRRAILRAAAELATVEGLEGLSIGRLAEETGMSKSGLYAHFASKQALQLATVETANEIFDVEVVQPALETPAGRERLVALCDAYLSHLQRDVFPGGCFFAATAADFGMRPGPVRDAIKDAWTAFEGLVAELIEEARARQEIPDEPETQQLAFELIGFLGGANASFVLFRDPVVLERARRAVRTRLAVLLSRTGG
jgi:AcrR family transcriptional regulator